MDANGKNCAEKLKTTSATRKTLDPFYNQILIFMEPYMQKILQVSLLYCLTRVSAQATNLMELVSNAINLPTWIQHLPCAKSFNSVQIPIMVHVPEYNRIFTL